MFDVKVVKPFKIKKVHAPSSESTPEVLDEILRILPIKGKGKSRSEIAEAVKFPIYMVKHGLKKLLSNRLIRKIGLRNSTKYFKFTKKQLNESNSNASNDKIDPKGTNSQSSSGPK